MSTPRVQGIPNVSLQPPFTGCGRKHKGGCLAGKKGYFSCSESGHMIKDLLEAKVTEI